MSKVSASAFTPFISAVSPSLMQMGSWQELANPRDLTKIFGTPEYAAWRSLMAISVGHFMSTPPSSVGNVCAGKFSTAPPDSTPRMDVHQP